MSMTASIASEQHELDELLLEALKRPGVAEVADVMAALQEINPPQVLVVTRYATGGNA